MIDEAMSPEGGTDDEKVFAEFLKKPTTLPEQLVITCGNPETMIVPRNPTVDFVWGSPHHEQQNRLWVSLISSPTYRLWGQLLSH